MNYENIAKAKITIDFLERKKWILPRVALTATRAVTPNSAARGSFDYPPRSCRCRSSTPEARPETRMADGKDLLASCGKHVLLAGFLPLLVDV